jgi:hypothetical protein
MDLKQLRNEVQLLRDELAITKRKYEDILYNLDDANFSERFVKEKDNMKTAITVTAEGIKTLVTKDVFESEMMQTASLIATKVSNTELGKYSTTAQTENLIQSAVNAFGDDYVTNSLFEQRANSIKMSVNAMYSNPEEVTLFNKYNADKDKVYHEKNENENINTYWYFNGEEWCESNNANFGTVFEQTSTGFALKGNVTISGNLLTQGEIKGLTVGTASNKFGDGVWLNSEESSLDIIYMNNVVGRWSSSDAPTIGSSIHPVGGACLNISNATATGNWDFSKCDGITWGNNAPVAVFG